MIPIETLQIGDKVRYQPSHYTENQWENGIVKEIPTHTKEVVRVVYNCAGNWNDYRNYTSALTNLRDLKLGWKEKEPESIDGMTDWRETQH